MFPCAILCGGLATRLRPATTKIPKSLLPINGKPFIAHQLSLLKARGVLRVILCIGYLGERIRDFVGDGSQFGLEVSYSFDGAMLLGTGGAIRRALPLFGDEFFVLYGDSYLTCDYCAIANAYRDSGKGGLMTIYRNEDRYDSSNIEVSAGQIVRYDKRNRTPDMKYVDYGLGVFGRTVFETRPENHFIDLADIYQELLAEGNLAAFEVNKRFYEIGSSQGIRDLETYLANRNGNRMEMPDEITI